jgi:hypothetical protein
MISYSAIPIFSPNQNQNDKSSLLLSPQQLAPAGNLNISIHLNIFVGDFLNPALALLGQGLKKSPIGQKLDFANHPYLCKGLILYNLDA